MGAGAVICLIVLTGFVAAEVSSGCCLCFVSFLFVIPIRLKFTEVVSSLMFYHSIGEGF
jgi:hypothetical protein